MTGRTRVYGEIDVAEELEKQRIEDVRGRFGDDAARRRTPGMRPFMAVVIVTALVIGGVLTWKAWSRNQTQAQARHKEAKVENTLPPFRLTVPAPEPATAAADPVMQSAGGAGITAPGTQPQKSPQDALRDRRFGGGFSGEADAGRAAAITPARSATPADPRAGDNPLEEQLRPLQLRPSRAGKLTGRDFLLTRGAMIDCGEQSKLVTDQVGLVACYTTADTYSANGHVILIDAGSKIVGSYQRGILQGQSRVFVAWQRIETPQGVIVDLDSPGTDPLGAAGLPGQVDSHFWQRFGGAIMLSLLSDAGQAAVNAAQTQTQTSITLGNTQATTQELATEALRNSINIPPTLYRNQGERVNIFVARDMDFSNVYGLR